MTVMIVHPGTGTIIEASECVVILDRDDAIADITETIEEAMSDILYRNTAPEGTEFRRLSTCLTDDIAKYVY